MLAAENSAIVPKKNQHRGPIRPQAPKLNAVAIHIRKGDAGKPAAVRIVHVQTILRLWKSYVKDDPARF
jgi:hypothetical protein